MVGAEWLSWPDNSLAEEGGVAAAVPVFCLQGDNTNHRASGDFRNVKWQTEVSHKIIQPIRDVVPDTLISNSIHLFAEEKKKHCSNFTNDTLILRLGSVIFLSSVVHKSD